MSFILYYMRDVMDYSKRLIKIPVIYLLFMVSLILYISPQYPLFIQKLNLFPANLVNVILAVSNWVYRKSFYLFIALLILLLITIAIYKLHRKFCSNSNIADKGIQFSPYSALIKILNIMEEIATTVWILYFFIATLLGDISWGDLRWQGFTLTIESMLLSYTIIMFKYNVARLVWNITKYIFYEDTTKFAALTSINDNYINRYHILNSFTYYNSADRKTCIAILKSIYEKNEKYYLVTKTHSEKSNVSTPNDWVSKYPRLHRSLNQWSILDSSVTLDVIIYHFDALKEHQSTELELI